MPSNAAYACRFFLACALLSGATPIHAGETPAPDKGYQDKTVQGTNGKPRVVRVMDSVGPRLHGRDTGPAADKYNPQNLDLGKTSSFSNKRFSSENFALSKNNTAIEGRGEHPFQTKSFSNSDNSNTDFSQKFQTASFADSSHANNSFTKSFATSSSKMAEGRETLFAAKTSPFQGVASPLADSKPQPFSGFADLSDKKFFDPAMTRIKRDPYAAANDLDVKSMSALPNRPLTIDEVRNLINHDATPNLDEKPDAPSKALNDPDYEPPMALPMKHDDLAPPGPEEKDSELPSPGTMAIPATPGSSGSLSK